MWAVNEEGIVCVCVCVCGRWMRKVLCVCGWCGCDVFCDRKLIHVFNRISFL